MIYELTIADEAGQKAALTSGGSGVFYDLGAEVDQQLRNHPLARSELGKPKRVDSVHLSLLSGTKDLVRWMARGPSGYHHQIGRVMKIIALPNGERRDV